MHDRRLALEQDVRTLYAYILLCLLISLSNSVLEKKKCSEIALGVRMSMLETDWA